jgi:prepilin-type N-terminal cleavage/methylation domain-containing protein
MNQPVMCRHALRRAFTLTELLAVIAIIGLVVALLLPAIQASREASRRASCSNKLWQIGRALQSFHASQSRFPPGAATDLPPFGYMTRASYELQAARPNKWLGSAWTVFLLPWMDHGSLYDQMPMSANSGWDWRPTSPFANNPMTIYRCPSSPLPAFLGGSWPYIAQINYAAIAGSAPGLIPGYQETRYAISNATGIVGGGGMIFPNSTANEAHCTDGLGNMLAIGEQSDYLIDSLNRRQSWTASSSNGWTVGTWNEMRLTDASTNPLALFAHNVTTIRYLVNQKQNNWNGGNGVGSSGANVPLNSAHPGGTNVCILDGAVRFAGDGMSLDVLARLATRNDGQVASGDF